MLEKLQILFTVDSESLLIVGNFQPLVVLLSISIAILASFMALQVSCQAGTGLSKQKKALLTACGSVALGGGVWSMHFIGMLAFDLCTTVSYNVEITALSFIPSVAASWVALVVISSPQPKLSQFIVGGILVGAGIGTMHYVGMAAMEMAPLLRYDFFYFSLSIVVAVVLAILALWARFSLNYFAGFKLSNLQKNAIAALVMGCAISGMHYAGMASARFVKPPGFEFSAQDEMMSVYLGFAVATITVMIILLVLVVSMLVKYKASLQQIKLSEAHYKATISTAADAIVTFDEHGIVESGNAAVETLLGYKLADMQQPNIEEFIPHQFLPTFKDHIRACLNHTLPSPSSSGLDVEAIHNDGTYIPVKVSIGYTAIEGKSLFVMYISDLRYRIEMQKALVKSEAQFRSLIANIPGIAYRCLNTENWPMVFISNAVERITGYPASDYMAEPPLRNFHEHLHPDDYQRVANQVNNESTYKLEYRIYDKQGNIHWLLGFGTRVDDADHKEKWLDGFIMDITDRKEMEENLLVAKVNAEQAAAARTAFLANMSHEIRTPMNAIIGFSDILLDESLTNSQQKHLHTINQSAKSLLHLLNDILDSAKLDKGKLELELRDFSIIEEVDSVVSTLWLEANKKGLYLNIHVSPDINQYYYGAPDRIRQILTNLIGNAIKFTAKGGVEVRVNRLENSNIELSIRDTGIGMTADQVKGVFDAFSQADASINRRFGGTGLGTTISKQLTELLGGEISVQSTFGEGSCFVVTLPLSEPHALHALKPKTSANSLPELRILLVDDIQQNLDLLSIVMERQGHSVSFAHDGQQALTKMQEDPIDLVIMDIQMPIMDGLTAATKRRLQEQQEGLPFIPIIALTASVLPEDKKAAFDAGMTGFANKPIEIDLLTNEIVNVLGLQSDSSAQTSGIVKSSKQACVNERKGIALWGDKATLVKEIQAFLAKHSSLHESISKLIAANEWSTIQATLHSKRGLAGNLSLSKLNNVLIEAERVSNSAKPSDLQAILPQIAQALSAIQDYLNAQKIDHVDLSESANQLDIAAAKQLINRIRFGAKDNQYNEADLETLRASLPQASQPYCSAIQNALDDFEFELALQELDALDMHINTLSKDQNL